MKSVVNWKHEGEQEKKSLHYTQCGLDDIYLLSGYEIEKTPHGDGLSIKNADQLHKAIGCYLSNQKKALSGKELRFLRKYMNLSQGQLGRLLGLSSQQVARWEKGESEISGPTDRLIRALFIQSVGGAVNLEELSRMLDEVDAPLNEKSYFENTGDEWRAKKAA
jgi:DNA-binding transcriptional regulator YiaG